MPASITDTINFPATQQSMHIPNLLMRSMEKWKLQHRARKYRNQEDPGGIRYIRDNIRQGDTVFDIGAHKGGYLYFFLQQLAGSGQVIAFEPQSVLYRYLCKLQQLFAWKNLLVEPYAVSDQDGKALLCIPHNHGKRSSPCATIIESHMEFSYQYSEQVPTISLDTYCAQHDSFPSFLKVDVEGNELMVFKGASGLLHTHRPKILFECEARFVGELQLWETFQFLQGIGYTGYFIMGKKVQPLSLFDPLSHQDISQFVYCNNFIFE